jgi:hypothetical protein
MIRTKVDRTGRSTNVLAGKRARKALGLPKGVGWNVPLPSALLDSPCWLVMSHRAWKALSAIITEHARTGGKENGALIVPYTDMERRGLRRSSIREAIVELEALGLITVTLKGRRSSGEHRHPSQYRLTWLGTPDTVGPTNEWRAIKSREEAELRIHNALARLASSRARGKPQHHSAGGIPQGRSNRAVTPA